MKNIAIKQKTLYINNRKIFHNISSKIGLLINRIKEFNYKKIIHSIKIFNNQKDNLKKLYKLIKFLNQINCNNNCIFSNTD